MLLDLQSSLSALGKDVCGLFGIFFLFVLWGRLFGFLAFCLVSFRFVALFGCFGFAWAFDAFCIVGLCTFNSVTGRRGNNVSVEIPVHRGMYGHTCGMGTHRYRRNRHRRAFVPNHRH